MTSGNAARQRISCAGAKEAPIESPGGDFESSRSIHWAACPVPATAEGYRGTKIF
jgi:hypothetical protein